VLGYELYLQFFMALIYHRVPQYLTGTVLYPLNVLREKYPDLYAARQKHHEFQPHVLDSSVPKLGCFWDDLLHFTALNPMQISKALQTLGYKLSLRYYEIDAAKLDPEKSIVYLNSPKEPGETTKISDFVPFNPDEVEKLAYIPEEMMERHKKHLPTADEFLINYGAPYILYKGELDVTGCPIIEL
jgi:hypothetical protein